MEIYDVNLPSCEDGRTWQWHVMVSSLLFIEKWGNTDFDFSLKLLPQQARGEANYCHASVPPGPILAPTLLSEAQEKKITGGRLLRAEKPPKRKKTGRKMTIKYKIMSLLRETSGL